MELLFSFVFYSYLRYSVDTQLRTSLYKQGKYLFATYTDIEKALHEKKEILRRTMNIRVRIDSLPDKNFRSIHFRTFRRDKHDYLEAYFPYDFALQQYVVLTADVTQQRRVQHTVTQGIILMNLFGMGGIILYAFFLSGHLVAPVRVFSRKLAEINARTLAPLDLRGVPDEFELLGDSLNQLIIRIQGFLNYKKELFVGTAHELKTPLAVIKTKAQVTLMKRKRTEKDLEEALRQTIRSVDDMNKIVGSILEFGRAEGAQFDAPERIDVAEFLHQMCREFALLAEQEGKQMVCRIHPKHQEVVLPTLLLRQILQNLLQNALKFTPKGNKITLISYRHDSRMVIRVRDEGRGLDEGMDVFAPFRRTEDSSGAGLGLFLVKSAADALRAQITIRNRRDSKGAVATLILPL